jgi:hypothetical protein
LRPASKRITWLRSDLLRRTRVERRLGLALALEAGMRQLICMFVIALSVVPHMAAAPLRFREVEFLVRQGVPEVEIIAEVKSRRVLDVPAPEQLATLRAQGASAHLIATLQLPEVKLSPEEVAVYEQLRKAQLEQAASQPAADDAPRTIIPHTMNVSPDELPPTRRCANSATTSSICEKRIRSPVSGQPGIFNRASVRH